MRGITLILRVLPVPCTRIYTTMFNLRKSVFSSAVCGSENNNNKWGLVFLCSCYYYLFFIYYYYIINLYCYWVFVLPLPSLLQFILFGYLVFFSSLLLLLLLLLFFLISFFYYTFFFLVVINNKNITKDERIHKKRRHVKFCFEV